MEKSGYTHAVGIVYRHHNQRLEFLIVTAKKNEADWVFPGGHIEPRESAAAAVLREVKEETGLEGKWVAEIGSSEYMKESEKVRATFHLIQKTGGREETAPEGRRWRWCAYPEALTSLTFENHRQQLEIAFHRINQR